MWVTRQLFDRAAWKRLQPVKVVVAGLAISLPWHVLATLANPPYFAFSLHSGPGEYRGFFWFYFFNEHLLRFMNLRYPRDYNTVPRLLFWLLNLVWLFPWSAYLAGAARVSYSRVSREGRMHLMAVCWIGAVMLFFTFSTTQEYYSLPIYPAMALLIGSAIAERRFVRAGTWILIGLFSVLFVALGLVLASVARISPKGELWQALTQNPEMYTLSLGHMSDLTIAGFAFLKLPLIVAVLAFGFCAVGLCVSRNRMARSATVLTIGMIVFFQAAHLALIRFDDYLGSYRLAEKLMASPPGQLIEANAYYAFSSVFFYANRSALLWNGRANNLEYGSYAPNAPAVFIGDADLVTRWQGPDRFYMLAWGSELPHLQELVGKDRVHVVAESGGNYLYCNQDSGGRL
jgi:hypothetical protein